MLGRILILAGTGPGRRLANSLFDLGYDIITSLAGRTSSPLLPRGRIYMEGGFGGISGLTSYLRGEKICLLIDATHPFSVRMSKHAVCAASDLGIPCLRLQSPPWHSTIGDNWCDAANMTEAVALVPSGVRVFLPLGRHSLAPFLVRDDIEIFARMIEPPEEEILLKHHIFLATPPFLLEEEIDFLRTHKIDMMVVKNSGHAESYSKLEAARHLHIRVIMIRPPKKPPIKTFSDINSLLLHLQSLSK